MTQDPGLYIRNGVVLTTQMREAIAAMHPYFLRAKLHAEVSSGVRTPGEQLDVIYRYALMKISVVTYRHFFDDYQQHLPLATQIVSPEWILKAMGLTTIYWWQEVWSQLLYKGIIINPPLEAHCLAHSLRANGTDRFGKKIPQTSHSKEPPKALDLSGGADHNPANEYYVLLTCSADKACQIKDILLERENNCCHIDLL